MDILTLTRRILLGLVSFALVINGVLLVLAKHRPADSSDFTNYSLKAYVLTEKEAQRLIGKFKGVPFTVVIKQEKRVVQRREGYDLVFQISSMSPQKMDMVFQYLRNNKVQVRKMGEQAIYIDYVFPSEKAAKRYARYINERKKVAFEVKPHIREENANVYYLEFSRLDQKSLARVRKVLKDKAFDITQSTY